MGLENFEPAAIAFVHWCASTMLVPVPGIPAHVEGLVSASASTAPTGLARRWSPAEKTRSSLAANRSSSDVR
eukprot:10024489-Prorocentrum_lima.AAC.1